MTTTPLVSSSIALSKEQTDEGQICYKLIIGTDPATNVVIVDDQLDAILQDLPKILSTVIQSQVLIESA